MAHATHSFQRALAVAIGLCLGLSTLVVFLLVQRHLAPPPSAPLLNDPETRREVVRDLAAGVAGVFDSHPDPDVGRVLLPSQDRTVAGIQLSTNAYGMREREYVLPKPEGLVRVVLLGDSFVFGKGAPAEDRLGVFLERFLTERAGPSPPQIECLHLAVTSWNIRAECAFLRRQLHELQPDLVVQIVVSNDIDDNNGVRGVGVMGNFDPAQREWATGRIAAMNPVWNDPRPNLLPLGLDFEGSSRLRAAGEQMNALAGAVEEQGGHYLLIVHWGPLNTLVHPHWGDVLAPEQLVWLPRSFWKDRSAWVSKDDGHWNRSGHERVARLLYGLVQRREYLPALELTPWDEASAEIELLLQAGLAEVEGGLSSLENLPIPGELTSVIDIAKLGGRGGPQIYGGIDAEGWMAPRASLVLRPAPGDLHADLHLVGSFAPAPVLDGATVTVQVNGEDVGHLTIENDTDFDVWLPMPAGDEERLLENVRLEADDFVYRGKDLRRCAVLRLDRIGIEAR